MNSLGYSSAIEGFERGLGLYQGIKRANLLEEQVKLERERQALAQQLEQAKAEVYLQSMRQQIENMEANQARAQRENEREEAMYQAGILAEKIRAAERIEDPKVRKDFMTTIAQGLDANEPFKNITGITPDRHIVGIKEIVNPKTKKRAYGLLIKNDTTGTTNIMTPSGAKLGQEPGIIFDADMLERIAGTKQNKRYVNTAKGLMTEEEAAAQGLQEYTPKSSNPSTYKTRYVNTIQGLMPEEEAYARGLQALALGRNGSGSGSESTGDFKKDLKAFYAAYPKVRPGKSFDFQDALQVQENAKGYGVFVRFNQRKDPETGKQMYFMDQVLPEDGAPPEYVPSRREKLDKYIGDDGREYVKDPSSGRMVPVEEWEKYGFNGAPAPTKGKYSNIATKKINRGAR